MATRGRPYRDRAPPPPAFRRASHGELCPTAPPQRRAQPQRRDVDDGPVTRRHERIRRRVRRRLADGAVPPARIRRGESPASTQHPTPPLGGEPPAPDLPA